MANFPEGKDKKKDVMAYELHLEDNIFSLYEDVKNNTYQHSPYTYFQIFDTKKRDIYKAEVRDRIIHQIVYDYLLTVFEPHFISDSYASRKYKGQYRALKSFCYYIKLANGKGKECSVLKCDVRKYFDNVDHSRLLEFIKEKVKCERIMKIINEIIASYHLPAFLHKGIPLGNITSQVFANVYLNVLDHYVKENLRCRFYIRYNDDLVIVFENRKDIPHIRDKIISFVREKLLLEMPIEKTGIRKIGWGVDFLGFVILPQAILLRDKTKHKIYENIRRKNIHSYLSILKHCNSYNLKTKILSMEKTYKI